MFLGGQLVRLTGLDSKFPNGTIGRVKDRKRSFGPMPRSPFPDRSGETIEVGFVVTLPNGKKTRVFKNIPVGDLEKAKTQRKRRSGGGSNQFSVEGILDLL